MSRQPYDRRSGVSEEQGVVRSQIAERFGQEFRTYGLDLRTFVHVVLQKTVERVRFRAAFFQEAPVHFFPHPLEHPVHGGLHVANKTPTTSHPPPTTLPILPHLTFFHFLAVPH